MSLLDSSSPFFQYMRADIGFISDVRFFFLCMCVKL
nr:MAG TPA: hypothetical protein [Caudoviricetes sp.]